MTKKQENALALLDSVKTQVTEAIGGVGAGGFPMAKRIDSQSAEIKEGIEGIKAGDVINTETQELITGEKFIPLKFFEEYIVFNKEFNIVARSESFDSKIAEAIAEADDVPQETAKKHAWKHRTLYILGYLINKGYPILIPFSKTSKNNGTQILRASKLAGVKMLTQPYTLETEKVVKKPYTWYVLSPKKAAVIDDKEVIAKIVEALKEATPLGLYDLVNKGGDPVEDTVVEVEGSDF